MSIAIAVRPAIWLALMKIKAFMPVPRIYSGTVAARRTWRGPK